MPQPIDLPNQEPESELNSIQRSILEGEAIETLQTIYDPELPVNIYDLGLIYDVQVDENAHCHVLMTLTSPNCPVAESLPVDVHNSMAAIPGIKSVKVDLTWDPPFTMDRMADHVKLQLGLL